MSRNPNRVYDRRTKSTSDTWLTPPEITKALGTFELDPASPISPPWNIAKRHYTEEDDGLAQKWTDRVWLNPPYGHQIEKWMKKMVEHGNGIALVGCRTETRWFHDWVWNAADAVFFLKGRLRFYRADGTQDGTAAFPSCLVAYGRQNVEALRRSGLEGHLVEMGKDFGRVQNNRLRGFGFRGRMTSREHSHFFRKRNIQRAAKAMNNHQGGRE